jgi:hypothetical protein
MSKQVFPVMPTSGQVYSDESGQQTGLNLDHLAESFRMSDFLKQLGHDDAAEFVRPVHLIAGFKPADLMQRLNVLAASCDHACIACINDDRLPEFIWHPAPNGVNEVVRWKLAGGHVLGMICFSGGSVTTYPVNGPDEPLSATLLTLFASGYQGQPDWIAAAQILALDKPESFEPENVEKTLDVYSAFTDAHPLDIHCEISTTTVQERPFNHARN